MKKSTWPPRAFEEPLYSPSVKCLPSCLLRGYSDSDSVPQREKRCDATKLRS